MKLEPSTFENFYRVLTGVVVPRPIAFVSTMSGDGVGNLAPYSFFNAVASDPPTIVFSSSRRTEFKSKDTLANIEETGEFVVNVVVDDIAEAMNICKIKINQFLHRETRLFPWLNQTAVYGWVIAYK